MNLEDVLKYGNRTVMNTIGGLSDAECNLGGVCGHWSVREIMAHLASHELLNSDVLISVMDADAVTPTLTRYFEQGVAFNDIEVENRSGMSYDEIVREYEAAAAKTSELALALPVAKRREVGLIPWYGAEYDLEDLFAYSTYGHKREHSAQIAVYRDTLGH